MLWPLLLTLLLAFAGPAACGSKNSGDGDGDVSANIPDTDRTGRVDVGDTDDDPDDIETEAPDTDGASDTDDGSGDADEGSGDDVEEPPLCVAGQRTCLNDQTWHRCNSEGDGWEEPHDCGDEHYCSSGVCAARDCSPEVMFLIDGSSGMVEEWPKVRASVGAVIAANPGVRFGLSMFPVDIGCPIGDENRTNPAQRWPHVAIQETSLAATAIETWFDANRQPKGATPIRRSLEWFTENTDAVWSEGVHTRYLVLLTDGEETCTVNDCKPDGHRTPEEEISLCLAGKVGEAAQALYDAGVQLYVIGYRYDGSPEALELMAQAGGTGLDTYVEAGDEASLTNAFQLVIDDLKLCAR